MDSQFLVRFQLVATVTRYVKNANKILRQMQEQEKEEIERQNNINLASNSSGKV